MIGHILWCLSAIINAFMDRIDDENIHQSIAKNWNWKFWYKRESDKNSKMIGKYRIDGWHLSKSSMVILLAFCAYYFGRSPLIQLEYWWLDLPINIIVLGIEWILVFNLFYNKIFFRK